MCVVDSHNRLVAIEAKAASEPVTIKDCRATSETVELQENKVWQMLVWFLSEDSQRETGISYDIAIDSIVQGLAENSYGWEQQKCHSGVKTAKG